jgi:hypothetical protein
VLDQGTYPIGRRRPFVVLDRARKCSRLSAYVTVGGGTAYLSKRTGSGPLLLQRGTGCDVLLIQSAVDTKAKVNASANVNANARPYLIYDGDVLRLGDPLHGIRFRYLCELERDVDVALPPLLGVGAFARVPRPELKQQARAEANKIRASRKQAIDQFDRYGKEERAARRPSAVKMTTPMRDFAVPGRGGTRRHQNATNAPGRYAMGYSDDDDDGDEQEVLDDINVGGDDKHGSFANVRGDLWRQNLEGAQSTVPPVGAHESSRYFESPANRRTAPPSATFAPMPMRRRTTAASDTYGVLSAGPQSLALLGQGHDLDDDDDDDDDDEDDEDYDGETFDMHDNGDLDDDVLAAADDDEDDDNNDIDIDDDDDGDYLGNLRNGDSYADTPSYAGVDLGSTSAWPPNFDGGEGPADGFSNLD